MIDHMIPRDLKSDSEVALQKNMHFFKKQRKEPYL